MKTALAIVCSLLLAWTPFVLGQVSGASGMRATHVCCGCDCSQASCCASNPLPESLPVSAAPASSFGQTQIVPLIAPGLIWNLPALEAAFFPSDTFPAFLAENAPLYTRNCALLI